MTPMQPQADELKHSLELQKRLNEICSRLHDAETFAEALPGVEPEMLVLLNAERITVYKRGRNDREIVSKFKSGTDIQEIRVPLTTASVAGFVALSQRSLCISDVYDNSELSAIHADLKFSQSFDKRSGFRTRSVVAVPIKYHEVFLGVLQILNRRGGGSFGAADLARAEEVAKALGQKFRYELRGTRDPYEYLVQRSKIKPERLEEFKQRSLNEGKSVHEMLLSEAGISKQELGASLEHYYQVPFSAYDPQLQIPQELIKGVNLSYLQKQLWVPIAGDRNQVTILIDDPTDAQRIMEIQRSIPAQSYIFHVGLPEDIRRFLGASGSDASSGADLNELVGRLQDEVQAIETEIIDSVDENEATVIQLVNKLIVDAYTADASDIHIEPGKGKANASVRVRVDGVCRPALSIPASHTQAVVSRVKIISGLDISERRKPQDGKCMVRFRGQPLELRVATIPTVHGESVVLRILTSGEPLALDKLNFSAKNLAAINEIVELPHGIVIVAGPTGSGKTTTLHAVLKRLNTPETKIWTAEDPVEITQPGLQQLQVQPKIGLTFAAALRSFLRADPDVIMIGEMRDAETAQTGIEASLTGHLVLSTLHTNSAAETIVRLLDLGVDAVNFSDALQAILAQRLVRTLCEKCKQRRALTEEELHTLRRFYGEAYFGELGIQAGKTEVAQAGKGCEKCGSSGYRGRVAVHELLRVSEPIRELIYRRATAAQIKEAALKEGMRTLMQDGIQKFLAGLTDLDQVRQVAVG